jgi:hypothetical protein
MLSLIAVDAFCLNLKINLFLLHFYRKDRIGDICKSNDVLKSGIGAFIAAF